MPCLMSEEVLQPSQLHSRSDSFLPLVFNNLGERNKHLLKFVVRFQLDLKVAE